MPLLFALALLVLVLGIGIALGLWTMLRRPFRAPAWQPVFGPPLALRAVLIGLGVLIALGIAAWRHPDALQALAIGLAAGGVLGGGAGATARLAQRGAWVQQQPRRIFAVLVAVALLGRTALALVETLSGVWAGPQALLPMLGGLLAGYALAHALVLRARLQRFRRVEARLRR